jgi:hypothetical protein
LQNSKPTTQSNKNSEDHVVQSSSPKTNNTA